MLYWIPLLFALIGIAIPRLALPHAHEFHRPERFRRGIWLVSAGLIILGAAPLLLYWTVEDWRLRNYFLLIVLIVPFGMIGFGFYKIAQANTAPRDDLWF
jgi:hypothetical protein